MFNYKDCIKRKYKKPIYKKCKDLNHHPKWTNIYNRVDVELFTHDLGGLSHFDFKLAYFMDLSFSPYSQ